MIHTSYSGSSNSIRGAQASLTARVGSGNDAGSDTVSLGERSTRGVFFGKPIVDAPKKHETLQASAASLQKGLGISKKQAENLAKAANQPLQEPYRAGVLDTGESFLITRRDFVADPAGFQGYDNAFRVYVMENENLAELPISQVSFSREGSLSFQTPAAKFDFPFRGTASVGGRPLTTRLDQLQLV